MKIDKLLFLAVLLVTKSFLVIAEDTHRHSDGGDLLKVFKTQVFFEENLGQFESDILYQTNVYETQVRFLSNGLSFAAIREIESTEPATPEDKHSPKTGYLGEQEPDYEGMVWRMILQGMDETVVPIGQTLIPGQLHYLKGNNQTTGVSRYKELWYEDVYEQIDLRYYGTGDHLLKYDFILKPGADLADIRMNFQGVSGISINAAGELVLTTPWGEVSDAAPYSYQMLFGKEKPVDIRYRLIDSETIGFEIHGEYDAQKALVLDPLTLDWGTFFHTSTSDDYAMATKRDALGNIYFTGYTKSLIFPVTPGVYQNTFGGSLDAYVAKFSPNGDNLIFATFLGGSDWELAYGLDLNAANETYISGFTASTDYPTTAGALQEVSGGGLVESFLTRLSANGDALIFSTYLGGSDRDYIYDMEINAAGEAYMTGFTLSANFPTTPGAYSRVLSSNGDIFVAKMAANGASLEYSTLIGGSQFEIGQAIEVNALGEAYVAGNTASTNFPVTAGVIQSSLQTAPSSPQEDGFLLRLDATGSNLIYATYFGGSASDVIYDLDLNAAGEVFMTGITYSADLPVTVGVYQPHISDTPPSLGDAFIARISTDATYIQYSTYLGGEDIDFGKSIEVNAYDEAHILGSTRSNDFPLAGEISGYAAMYDVFLTVLDADGTTLTQSTLLGGAYNEYPRAPGSLYLANDKMTIAATTHSSDAEVTTGGYQTAKTNGVSDAPWILNIQVATVLPATVSSFTAKWEPLHTYSLLEWAGSREIPGITYQVERRLGQEDWQAIGTLPAQPTPDAATRYAFVDQEAARMRGRTVLYRLSYTGNDGAVYYSQVESIEIPAPSQIELRVYPNPTREQVNVEVLLPDGAATSMEIVDLIGKVVVRHDWAADPTNEIPLRHQTDLSQVPAGLYYLQIKTGTGLPIVQPLVIVR